MQPKVSVIIPVYNVEKYLRQCLDSIINQTLKEIEIICVDDGSTDKSLKILQEYKEKDNRFIILTQQNQHAGVARNNGLKIAKGKYLSFLDSDDFFELNMLEEMYNKAEKDQSDIVVCEYKSYNNVTKKNMKHIKIDNYFVNSSPFSFKNMPNKLCGVCNPNPWTKLFSRKLFLDNNLQFDSTICFNDFTCVMTALAVANKISIINKPFIHYRINQKTNLTGSVSIKYRFDTNLKIIPSLYNNLCRLNIIDLYKDWFENKAKHIFKDDLDEEIKNLAANKLPDNIFKMIYEKSKPLVSIVVTVYNTRIEYLIQCINSILNQTYKNIEILVVDDCSNVDYKTITALSPKIKLIHNETNLGCSKNAKKGFNLASGKYIIKIDSDDYVAPTLLEKEVNFLENNFAYGAVCCEIQRVRDGKSKNIIKRPIKWSLQEALFGDMSKYGYAGGMMFRANLLKSININTQYRVCEDFDFHLQILEHTNIKSIHETLYFYRSHDKNIMISARGGERAQTIKQILDAHRKQYNLVFKKPGIKVVKNTRLKNKYF